MTGALKRGRAVDVETTEAIEDYVKAIYSLQHGREEPVTTSALAERLAVTAGSASGMVRLLSGAVAAICEHLDQVNEVTPSSTKGCTQCLASGDRWTHLRLCLTCGEVGCCDSSPNRHASKHAAEHGHPVVLSFEPGEDWSWCYVDEVAFVVDELPVSVTQHE